MATATKKANGRNNDASPEDIADQLAVLREDLSVLTKTIADLGQDAGDDALAALKSKAGDVRDKASQSADAARAQTAQLQAQANDFIRDQPAAALGIAAGLGFLVGLLGARR